MVGYWKEEEDDFRDMPDEINEGQASAIPQFQEKQRPVRPRPQVPVNQQVAEVAPVEPVEYTEDGEEDYSTVLLDAGLRLEQGNLYKMLMNQDIFHGLDADPRAIKHVQREIRTFAKERMELMLGMRQTLAAPEALILPFNDLEISVLKKLASDVTGGVTQTEDANKHASWSAPKKQTLTPVASVKRPTQATLAPISAPARQTAPAPLKQTTAPISRPTPAPKVLKKTEVVSEELLNKPIAELTEQELIDRNKIVSQKQKRRRAALPQNRVPMPSEHQMAAMAGNQADASSNSPGIQRLMEVVNVLSKKK